MNQYGALTSSCRWETTPSTPEKHLSQCYYVHHKPHKDGSGIEPGLQTWIWRLTDRALSWPQILEQNYTQIFMLWTKYLDRRTLLLPRHAQQLPKFWSPMALTQSLSIVCSEWRHRLLQKRYTAPRYVTSVTLFINRWEWNRQDNNWFLYCINAMVRMSSTGCFQSGGLNMLDKFILPVVPLLHS
jgi:hypothetical protein